MGLAAAAAVLASSVAAHALTITNRDPQEHTVTFEDDDGEQSVAVAANSSIEMNCPKGCVVVLGKWDLVEFKKDQANGTVHIEDGKLKP